MANEILAAWLLTVALHASALLGIAWIIDRGRLRSRPAWREMLWRAAFFGGIATASVQVLLDTPSPARIALHTGSPHANALAPVASKATAAGGAVAATSSPRISESTVTMSVPLTTPSSVASPVAGPHSVRAFSIVIPSWHLMLIAGWLAGALIALARLATAWLRLQRSHRTRRTGGERAARDRRCRARDPGRCRRASARDAR